MVQNIKVNGIKTVSMEKEYNIILMVHDMKDNLNMERKMVKVNLFGRMEVIMKDNL